MPSKNIANQIY